MNAVIKKYFFILIISLFGNVGCEPTMIIGPIVTGVTYWIQGESHRYFAENKEIILNTTKHVLIENKLEIKNQYTKNNVYYMDAGVRNRFKIKIETIDNFTRLSMRINTFGDKDYTELLYKQIEEKCNIIYYEDGKPVSVD
jgi:hypothetical protein